MWRGLRAAAHALAPLGLASGGVLVARCQADGGGLSTTFPIGLTGPGATDKFYTSRLDLEAPLLLRGSGDFMAAARADARERLGLPQGAALGAGEALALEASVREHLSRAFRKCTAFLDSGRVHSREELRGALEDVFRRKGQMALLLGGKSVGKSQLLAEFARRTDIVGADGATRAVLHVDARRFSTDLSAGLQAALAGAAPRRAQGSREEGASSSSSSSSSSHVTSATLSAKLKGIAVEARLRLAETLTPMQRNLEMLSSVAELAEAQGLHVCLVVDEANLAFPTPPSPHPGAVPTPLSTEREVLLRDTQLLLERLVLLTKQSRKMNALMVSSEYGYPYRLRHENFFNTTNLTASIFAGEVPPADMRALLRDEWGVGPRLADVFLAYYGGHVHMASQALPELAARLDGFKCERVAPDGALGAIVAALGSSSSSSSSSPEGRGAAALLRSAAQQGFARVQHEGDANAQALARANLGGLVKAQGLVVGLPESVRGDANFGFVPSSHFLRHLIAKELYAERKARELCAEREARGWLGGWRWPWGP
jgi:hypothetical protein